jgi:hypothetical protein
MDLIENKNIDNKSKKFLHQKTNENKQQKIMKIKNNGQNKTINTNK